MLAYVIIGVVVVIGGAFWFIANDLDVRPDPPRSRKRTTSTPPSNETDYFAIVPPALDAHHSAQDSCHYNDAPADTPCDDSHAGS